MPRVIARLTQPANRELFTTAWGIDIAVATADILIASSHQEVNPIDAGRLYRISRSRTTVVDVDVTEGSSLDGITIAELTLPHSAAILALRYQDQTSRASPRTRLRPGHRLILLVGVGAETELRTMIRTLRR